MKKLLLTITGFVLTLLAFAQSPNLLNYQGVARNGVGNVLPNQPVGLRLSILNGGPTGPAVYSETRNVTTNTFGLFNVQVGSPGAITSTGTIAGINWTAFGAGSGTKFLKVEIDAQGGTNYFNVGSTQLVSVPYALNAAAAAPVGPAGGDLSGTYPNPTVARIQGRAVSAAAPANKNLLMWDAVSTSWIPATAAQAGVVSGTGTLNMVAKWTPDGTTIGNSQIFDNGTNVGVGTLTPTHKFTVSHGGSTGIGINSTAGFSVVDIDAASGDAALRFGNAGVNQWNMRNRPGDNYLEWFELGGGGSRMVIQDATGNVGIGETANPTYKLDVLHGGSTGIRSRSSGSFSVVDIDANSGDAALRFIANGVSQWNTRNRPADNYYEIFELGGGGSRMVIQDATGNVGIGETTAPSYKLDVLHGGSTGIRSRSSASFSVVDIDANSGDAALRFQKAGVNQWNIRNRPADDYLEIFELGGGGSRMVIQDATGNVGIGETTNPAYKLDVLHSGATGIRSRSSASFSVVDIDANSGDAALRFQKAGVNQWNTRNNPGTDDYQIFEMGGGGERLRIENTTGRVVISGDLDVAGTLTKGAGAFKIDHPLDPANKYLVHSFVESPDMMNIYNGNIVTDASGKATVQLPDYFEALNMEFRYQLTVMGVSFAQAIVSKEVTGNKFEITTNMPNVKVSWQVTGVRHDAYAQKNRIPNTIEKEAKNKGKYLSPESFNMPKTSKIGYSPEPEQSSLKDVKAPASKVANPLNTNGGSLTQGPIVAPEKKSVENSGSVAPQVKKEEAKPVVKQTEKGSTEQ